MGWRLRGGRGEEGGWVGVGRGVYEGAIGGVGYG